MTTLLWPPLAPHDASREADGARRRELAWLLATVHHSLPSLASGLGECARLLAPHEPAATLALSSQRSEQLKGFITRVGTRIVKGDVHLRLPSLPPPKGRSSYKLAVSLLPTAPAIVLHQLTAARTLIDACLDVVDATRRTGDGTDAPFLSAQLRLLHENIRDAEAALKGGADDEPSWCEIPLDRSAFDPPLPAHLSFHLFVSDAAVVVDVRTLEPLDARTAGAGAGAAPSPAESSPFAGLRLRERLASAWTGSRPAAHEEAHRAFTYRDREVRVRDKIRVESQDPSLMAAMAKLRALERNVTLSRRALDTVMGNEHDGN